jgi:hypothetical protein
MNRYKLTLYTKDMVLSNDGEWVHYDDVKKLENDLNKANNRFNYLHNATLLKIKENEALKEKYAKYSKWDDLKTFVGVFDRLCVFESDQHRIRGYGAFTEEERKRFPLPEVTEFIDWLHTISSTQEKT